jgi:hypothetical protein
MRWFISHKSAFEFWRDSLGREALAHKSVRGSSPPIKPSDARKLREENPQGLSKPLHVLVGSGNARKAAQGLHCHVGLGRFPAGSFLQVTSEYAVCSPELCFVQMAGELSLVELVSLGYEFCGTYRLGNRVDAERGFRDDVPHTSVVKLGSFIAKCAGHKGVKKAQRALRYIADGSASPMETVLTMLLCLPYQLGGYGFPLPQLNLAVDIQGSARNAGRKARYYCDLYWAKGQVDVEYDSDAYHVGSERIAKDALRRNALASAGITVMTVSKRQIDNTAELRETAERLSKLLGKRRQCPMPEFTGRHAELRKQLLPRVFR